MRENPRMAIRDMRIQKKGRVGEVFRRIRFAVISCSLFESALQEQ